MNEVERVTKYQRHSDTSKAAAQAIEMSATTLRGKVYRYLVERSFRGATDEELQTGLAMNPNTQRPRRVELLERGLIYDSKLRRKTASKRKAVVWIATIYLEIDVPKQQVLI